LYSKELCSETLDWPIDKLINLLPTTKQALGNLERIINDTEFDYATLPLRDKNRLITRVESVQPLSLEDQPLRSILDGYNLLTAETAVLANAMARVSGIAKSKEVRFDGTPDSVLSLSRGDGIREVLPGVVVDAEVITTATKAAEYHLSDLPISICGFSRPVVVQGLKVLRFFHSGAVHLPKYLRNKDAAIFDAPSYDSQGKNTKTKLQSARLE